jgi:hypothetical protein
MIFNNFKLLRVLLKEREIEGEKILINNNIYRKKTNLYLL